MNIGSFGIIGGDKRQLYLADSIRNDGHIVRLFGFDSLDDGSVDSEKDLSDVISMSDALILPLPLSRNGKDIFAPFSSKPISIDDIAMLTDMNKPVFCGLKINSGISPLSAHNCFFYGTREEFAAANAIPTAEGAIACAMENSDITLCGSDCLVTGYGRIGRVLSMFLRGLGATVTVSARKYRDIELIRAAGMASGRIENISGHFDFIFNTVPSLILDRKRLEAIGKDSLIIDLASLPGGVDDSAANELSVPLIHALSLPGKVAPKTAGKIIKNAVYNIIGEESL